MVFCTQCGTGIRDAQHFCWNCGAKAEVPAHVSVASKRQTLSVPSGSNAASTPTKSFGRLFGLDPRVAVLSLIVDMMLNAGDIASMGLLLPVSITSGAVLGYVVYRAQMNWYGDDPESAKIKGIILGLLTAIPTPLPELLYVPAALVGLYERYRSRVSHS